MQRLGMWASAYDCAVVLIGHLNKKEGTKDLYAGQQWPHDPDHSGICGGGRTSFQINYYELVY